MTSLEFYTQKKDEFILKTLRDKFDRASVEECYADIFPALERMGFGEEAESMKESLKSTADSEELAAIRMYERADFKDLIDAEDVLCVYDHLEIRGAR